MNRQPDETVRQYMIRLCRDKDTLGLSWDGVADLVGTETGERKSSTTLRKWYAGYRDGYDDGIGEHLSGDELLAEYEDKRIEMQKERVRLADQRRTYSTIIRDQARQEYIREELVKSIAQLAERKPMVFDYTPPLTPNRRAAWLLATDWHRGMFANNHWNTFNEEEFDKRVKRLTEKVVTHSHTHDAKELHVGINGDMVEGVIHVSGRIQSIEDVIAQTQNVSESIAEMLYEYAKQFNVVYVRYVFGNHGRVISNKSEAQNKENFDRLIPWFLKARLQNVANVKFIENTYDEDVIDANVVGWDILAVHGDKDSPANVVQNLSLMIDNKPHFVYMGHLHKYLRDEIHGTYVILSPALCGTGEYSKGRRLTSHAAQLLTIFDKEEGELCTYPILFDRRKSS